MEPHYYMPDTPHNSFNSGTGLYGSVLVIENDTLMREALQEILTIKGMKVYAAPDGLKGEEIYRLHQNDIDMIILDWRLPGQNGRDTLRKIHQLNPNAQVIISSGSAREELAQELDDQPPVAFLSKPFNVEMLIKQVQKLLA